MQMTHKKRNATVLFLSTVLIVFVPAVGVCAEAKAQTQVQTQAKTPETVEIEYNGKLVTVPIDEILLISGDHDGRQYELADPEKYGLDDFQSAIPPDDPGGGEKRQEISAREYEEEQQARQWMDVTESLELRAIDRKALALVKEFDRAKGAVPPVTGSEGNIVFTWGSYTPKIVCRPMYVTDILLQPGETVTDIHPGDPVRWSFVPGRSGSQGSEQAHVLIKPLMTDISTNLVVNTDRRVYHFDLVANTKDFMPSVSFTYPQDTLNAWDKFIADRHEEQKNSVTVETGYHITPENLHLAYEIRGSDSLRWKPTNVYDDGVKTYIRFPKGSTTRSVEAPIFIVFEKKKEILVNYRVANDMYIVDRVFDKGALIVGTGAHQDRVVITRLSGK